MFISKGWNTKIHRSAIASNKKTTLKVISKFESFLGACVARSFSDGYKFSYPRNANLQ